MSIGRPIRVCMLMLGFAALPGVSLGQVSGVVTQVDASVGTGASFKVYLPVTSACSGSPYNWAYVNSVDANYNAIVATLLAAKAQGSTVTIYATADSGTNYCHISVVQAQ